MKLSSFLRGTPSYLRIGKGQLYNDRMSQGKFIWGYPKNELMSISRVEQMKHIESKVRRCNKKFQADRQSFIAWNRVWMGFRATGISIVSDTEQINRRVARELHRKSSTRDNFDNRVYRRVRFWSCEIVGYGPTMWVKSRKGGLTSCTITIARHVRE